MSHETPNIPRPEEDDSENSATEGGVVLPFAPELSEEQETELDETAGRHPAGHEHTRAYRPKPPEPLA